MKLVRIALLSVLLLTAFVVGTPGTQAQAISTASKSAEISAFGGYMPLSTDYGPHSLKGLSAGADFTYFPHFPVAPSFEIRATDGFAQDVTERTLSFGFRIQRDVHERFHPYVDALIGVGQVIFHPDPYPDYSSDESRTLTFGGGVNIDVSHHLGLKIDAQRQSWNFGPNTPGVDADGDFTLTPITAMIGVTYTIPFRVLNRHSDFH